MPSRVRVAFGRASAVGSITCVLVAASAVDTGAKEPGRVHCYGDVCHRVRTIEETRRLIGKTLRLHASHYDDPTVDRFNRGVITSNGEAFNANSPARVSSSDLPDGTELLLRNPANGRTSHVRVNDFGPFYGKRLIDVTRRVAHDLGFERKGVTPLDVTIIAAPRPEEAVYRRNRVLPPTLGFIGEIGDMEVPALVRRLVRTDRRLDLMARRTTLLKIPQGPDVGASELPPPDLHALAGQLELDATALVPQPQVFDLEPVALDPHAPATGPVVTIAAAEAVGSTRTSSSALLLTATDAPATGGESPAVRTATLTDATLNAFASGGARGTPIPALAVIEAKLGGDRALMPLLLAIMMSALLVATWAVSYARPPLRRDQRAGAGRATPATDVAPGLGQSTAAMFRSAPADTLLADTPAHATATPDHPEPAPQRDIESIDAPTPQSCSIGSGVEIVGNVFATGPLVISGHIRGDIVAPEVEIRHGGRVQGNVESDRLTVVGTLVGTARVRLLELRESGRLIGEMEAATFAFDHGAEIEAAVRTRTAGAADAGAVSPS